MKKIVGILVCMLMIIPVLATTVTADPELEAEIEINDGFGVNYKITNIGDEPIDQSSTWVKVRSKLFNRGHLSMRGANEPILPGESYSEIYIFKLLRFIRQPIMFGTVTVTLFEVMPGTWPIIEEKSVDALYIFGFVIILSE